jgi:hypothetical protein
VEKDVSETQDPSRGILRPVDKSYSCILLWITESESKLRLRVHPSELHCAGAAGLTMEGKAVNVLFRLRLSNAFVLELIERRLVSPTRQWHGKDATLLQP